MYGINSIIHDTLINITWEHLTSKFLVFISGCIFLYSYKYLSTICDTINILTLYEAEHKI